MAQQFSYNYAILDDFGMCEDVRSSSSEVIHPNFIPIEDCNPDYLFKYYNRETGLWYEDAEFTIEWSPEA